MCRVVCCVVRCAPRPRVLAHRTFPLQEKIKAALKEALVYFSSSILYIHCCSKSMGVHIYIYIPCLMHAARTVNCNCSVIAYCIAYIGQEVCVVFEHSA